MNEEIIAVVDTPLEDIEVEVEKVKPIQMESETAFPDLYTIYELAKL